MSPRGKAVLATMGLAAGPARAARYGMLVFPRGNEQHLLNGLGRRVARDAWWLTRSEICALGPDMIRQLGGPARRRSLSRNGRGNSERPVDHVAYVERVGLNEEDYRRAVAHDAVGPIIGSNIGTDASERAAFFGEIEQREKRVNALLQRRVVVELPAELAPSDWRQIMEEFAHTFAALNLPYMYVVHLPETDQGSDSRNVHAHLLYFDRPMTRLGPHHWVFSSAKEPKASGPSWMSSCRRRYSELCQERQRAAGALTQGSAGLVVRVYDPRSYRKLGIEKKPAKHLGLRRISRERSGLPTDRGQENAAREIAWRQKSSAKRLASRANELAASIQHIRATAGGAPGADVLVQEATRAAAECLEGTAEAARLRSIWLELGRRSALRRGWARRHKSRAGSPRARKCYAEMEAASEEARRAIFRALEAEGVNLHRQYIRARKKRTEGQKKLAKLIDDARQLAATSRPQHPFELLIKEHAEVLDWATFVRAVEREGIQLGAALKPDGPSLFLLYGDGSRELIPDAMRDAAERAFGPWTDYGPAMADKRWAAAHAEHQRALVSRQSARVSMALYERAVAAKLRLQEEMAAYRGWTGQDFVSPLIRNKDDHSLPKPKPAAPIMMDLDDVATAPILATALRAVRAGRGVLADELARMADIELKGFSAIVRSKMQAELGSPTLVGPDRDALAVLAQMLIETAHSRPSLGSSPRLGDLLKLYREAISPKRQESKRRKDDKTSGIGG